MLNDPKELLSLVKDIHWKIQESTESSALFFKITESSLKYLDELKNSKYKVLILNKESGLQLNNSFIIPESEWSELQKNLLDRLYPIPAMRMIGITGTNGKTTTTDLVLQLAKQVGKNGLSIGTLGVRSTEGLILDFGLTSPSFIDLRKYLFTYGKDKDFCVMEISSHALMQERIYKIELDAAGWVSFSQDHLDYHNTMEEYFKAKLMIYNHLKKSAKLFVPHDQKKLLDKISETNNAYPTTEISGTLPLFFSTKFNQNNLEVAKNIIEEIFGDIGPFDYKILMPPDGRFYIQSYKNNYIVVDFAHTPDALENICSGIKKSFPDHRLRVLFGCGGNRDKTKRPLMAAVADKYADKIYVTSDNPRNEDADKIIDDIVSGITSQKYIRITKRPEAVVMALSELEEKDILLLAGKGHENYILINGIKHPYSDIGAVEDFLKKAIND